MKLIRGACLLAIGIFFGWASPLQVVWAQSDPTIPIDIHHRPYTLLIGGDGLHFVSSSNPIPVVLEGPGTFAVQGLSTPVSVGSTPTLIPPSPMPGRLKLEVYGASANTARLYCCWGDSSCGSAGAHQGFEIGPDGQRDWVVSAPTPLYCWASSTQKAIVGEYR